VNPAVLELSRGQRLAADQLAEIADLSDGAVEVLRGPYQLAGEQSVVIDVALDCAGIPAAPAGLKLRAREAFAVEVDAQFPFTVPRVRVRHGRWADVPHVQWQNLICLYVAPSVEWDPADGMRGLLDRLIHWLRQAATGNLDPEDQPLHPPVAYVSLSAGVAVVHPDLPESVSAVTGPPAAARLMVALCRQDRLYRVDVTEWMTLQQWKLRYQAAELDGTLGADGYRLLGAPVIILGQDIGFEYPDDTSALLAAVEGAGADRSELVGLLTSVATINARLDAAHGLQGGELPARPLRLFVGTPSRRTAGGERRRVHLVCWQIDRAGQEILAAASRPGASDPQLADAVSAWAGQASTTWVPVMEARPEVTRRRDAASSAAWLAGKRVLVLGCGALGAPAAEACVRAGAREVTVADNGLVRPGILVRQPYEDADIGRYKALALTERLNRIHADDRVKALPQDIITTILTDSMPARQYDLIIDAAANAAVTARLEYCRTASREAWPPVMTMIIGHDARRGILALSQPGASGAGRDILRKLGLAACGGQAGKLTDIREDFYPAQPRSALFQPEPGCSDPTFTGSATEAGALAAHLLTAGLDALANRAGPDAGQPMSAAIVRLDPVANVGTGTTWYGWQDDILVRDQASAYEVRLSPAALREAHAESARGNRVRGRDIETGGMLFGQIDDACQCIWIDVAAGPPPDSTLSAIHFQHGTKGAQQLADYHRDLSQGNTVFTGMWHTHPDHRARPSPTDAAGIRTLLATVPESPRAVMIILGGSRETWTAWLDDSRPPDIYAELVRKDPSHPLQEMPVPPGHASSAWPGGYITAEQEERGVKGPQLRPWWLRRFWWPGRKGARR